MGHYNSFKTVVYIPSPVAARFTPEKLAYDYDYIEKYIGLDKVYLETWRDGVLADREQLKWIRDFFLEKGVEVAGGITATTGREMEDGGKQRLFTTWCYSNEAMREKMREISEYTASIYDEFILDDFFFTNCTCEECIAKKGDRDWVTFREELMTDVSENLILGPAKKVNPKCRVTIKYPNWRESYHRTGYCPGVEKDIFDRIYTGTETRSTMYADQHLPEYLGYSLMRWMESAKPGRNGGGWFDSYQCFSVDRYLEQAYLTAFARPREMMMFQWADLIDSRLTAPLGVQYAKLDALLQAVGQPAGVPVYIPFRSDGENHYEDHLGMQGLALDPTPYFPGEEPEDGQGSAAGAKAVLLTESSAADPEIMKKLRRFVLEGKDAVVTTGFVSAVCADGRRAAWEELSEVRLTGRKLLCDRYDVTDDWFCYPEKQEGVLFPDIQHGNNAAWSYINAGSGDYHCALFLKSTYGKGRVWILATPENPADWAKVPAEVLNPVRRVLAADGLYVEGHNLSFFRYDNDTFALYAYVKAPLHGFTAKVRSLTPAKELEDIATGRKVPFRKVPKFTDMSLKEAYVAAVPVMPGEFLAGRVIR